MKLKKLTAFFLSLVIIISGLALGAINSYALTVTLTDAMLDHDISKEINGYDDKITYVFTPTTSGVYTLYGLDEVNNRIATEAYLFLKTEDKDGKKLYTQLAYSNSNPDYANYEGSARRQFCLKYHLVAGEHYYYYAGWNNEERKSGTIGVRFICESYDTANLVSITPSCSAELIWYTDGSWETDDSGDSYYLYNISKIMQNMSLTLEFDDGTVLTSDIGDTTVNGYPITYTHNQQEVHWYNSSNAHYTSNALTITVLGKSVDYEVVINESAMLTISGKIIDDYDSTAVADAELYIGVNKVATTDSSGEFSFVYSPGTYNLSIKGENILERTVTLSIDTSDVTKNNHKDNPVGVITLDYENDGIINGRDFAYIKRNMRGSALSNAKAKFEKYVGFSSKDYKTIEL